MKYTREIQVKYDVDVFVAGGGVAGVAAAVAASRMGKKVFLAEATGAFGGLGTSGMVPAITTLYDGKNFLCSGIGLEIRKNICKNQPIETYWTTLDVEEYKAELDRIMVESGCEFSFFTTLVDCIVENGRVVGAVLNAKSGMFIVKAKTFVDCTGDGDLCAMAGADFEVGDENGDVMPPTLCSMFANVDIEEAKKTIHNQGKFVEEAFKEGILTHEDRHLPGMFLRDDGLACGNLGHTFGTKPLDETSLTKSMLWGRISIREYEEYYKKYHGGYSNMTLCQTGSILGVRESRRITCDYTLSIDDFLNRAEFEDEVGRYCYPVDIHVMNTNKDEYERFVNEYEKNLKYKKGESYGIPFRCLIPKKLKNVLVAGRCVGTDRKMQASIRVMPGCFITGQAAGVGAAIAANLDGTVRNVNYGELREGLLKTGAYLR